MYKLVSLLLFLLGTVLADEELRAGSRSTVQPQSLVVQSATEDCPHGRLCGEVSSAGCDDDCTSFIHKEGDCVFAATTFEGGFWPVEDLWMRVDCDETTYEVSFYGAADCTDFRTMWTRPHGTCIAFVDIPSFVVDECNTCLTSGSAIGAIVGIILGFLLLIVCCWGCMAWMSNRARKN
jgi:hypothetical protein